MADIDSEPSRRILISHESAASASTEMAQRFVDELGYGQTHIAITLRPPVTMLPSRWTQFLKYGLSETFEDWLKRVYGEAGPSVSMSMQRHLDQAGLVERWASVAGPQNVTVIVVDNMNPGHLTDTFEQLLGVPHRTLTGTVTGGLQTNRSMSLPEAEMFRQVNAAVYRRDEISWPVYVDVVRSGAIGRVLNSRFPTEKEPRVRMPRWAADRARRDGEIHANRIKASGVRVVGDLDALSAERPVAEDQSSADPGPSQQTAVEALTGAVYGAIKNERKTSREVTKVRKLFDKERSNREEAQNHVTELKSNLKRERAQRRKLRREVEQLKGSVMHDHVQQLPSQTGAQTAADAFTTHSLIRAVTIRLRRQVAARRLPLKRKRSIRRSSVHANTTQRNEGALDQ